MADQEIHQTILLKEITVEFNPEACPHKMEEETNEITVKIICPSGDTTGLCFTFDLSSTTPIESEPIHSISFYFLGDNKNIILISENITRNEDNREQKHELGFDYSQGFHDYETKWYRDFIQWSVDGKDASMVKDGEWAGDYDGIDAPYVCVCKDVRVPLLTEVAVVVTPVEKDPEDEGSVKVDFRSLVSMVGLFFGPKSPCYRWIFCQTDLKVAGSNPGHVLFFFFLLLPSASLFFSS
ncbi:hypothetical protein MKW98_020504 [Papaver atlanticum]|uniref:GH16 domain-containing protein n=1 Tax=Papaver atlanticum TaxID=357466 RepID=A0AAD4T380_9MAGN|nr:hypothetical protein MKW98_020504 [Papaver atlanticum]